MNDGQYGPARAYLHIGLMRSGTSFVQRQLTRHRAALRLDGMLFPGSTAHRPGERHSQPAADRARQPGWHYARQVAAAREAVDVPGALKAAELDGAWDALVDELDGWHGHRAIVSVEQLSLAKPAQIRAITASLEPAEVHVVLTVRDIARVVPSAWQDTVQNGLTWSLEDYLAALTESADEPGAAQRFWRQHDVLDIVDRWSSVVGVDSLHVVTVPPSGAPVEELWHRFCQAIGLSSRRYPLDAAGGPVNASLDGDAVELLRQLNLRLAGKLEPAQYQRLVKRPLARGALAQLPVAHRLRLPADQHAWFVERTSGVVDGLLERGVRVTGDLRDLVSPPDPTAAGPERAPEDLERANQSGLADVDPAGDLGSVPGLDADEPRSESALGAEDFGGEPDLDADEPDGELDADARDEPGSEADDVDEPEGLDGELDGEAADDDPDGELDVEAPDERDVDAPEDSYSEPDLGAAKSTSGGAVSAGLAGDAAGDEASSPPDAPAPEPSATHRIADLTAIAARALLGQLAAVPAEKLPGARKGRRRAAAEQDD